MSRDHSIDCPNCGENYGGMNDPSDEEHPCELARLIVQARVHVTLDGAVFTNDGYRYLGAADDIMRQLAHKLMHVYD